ncbi:MAG: hypothetical protein IJL98_05520 [Lachnospiraceae bacterium]|nr:hypothetical protein [Lachnospiraceae bacterium]MBR0087180.1 hypothetical protein [Lachnospiraceae bacterium]
MKQEKLIIPTKKYRGETAVVSARLPKTMVDELDRTADRTGYNRNEVISICLEYALNHLEEGEEL